MENPRAWERAYSAALKQHHPSESELAKVTAWIQEHEEELELDCHPPGLLEKLRDLEQALVKAWTAVSSAQKLPKSKAAVFDAATGKLVLKGKSLSLVAGEKYVLTKLVAMRTATFTELQTQHPRPDRVLKGLLNKYSLLKKFITLPGGPGRGGYSTTIEPTQAD